jgi:hypothetical protein
MTTIGKPKIEKRPKITYMGIRIIAPFKGMSKEIGRIADKLNEWVRAQGMDFDRWDTEQGDNFRGRYETFLTDPRVEPRKSKWKIEVAIKLAD